MIDSIALLHQYQRDIKTITTSGGTLEYIEVTLNDIKVANELAHEILGKTLDELPPQTRKLLKQIQQMVIDHCQQSQTAQSDYRFSRKQIRAFTGWGNTQLKIHCKRLEDMEYLLVHRGCRGQSMEYELLFDNDDESHDKHLMGLIDVKKLTLDEKKSGQTRNKSVPSRPQVGGVSALLKSLEGKSGKVSNESEPEIPKCTTRKIKTNGASYRNDSSSLVAQG